MEGARVSPDSPLGVRPGEPGYLEGKGTLVVNQRGCCPFSGGWPLLRPIPTEKTDSLLLQECKACAWWTRCMVCFPVYLCGRDRGREGRAAPAALRACHPSGGGGRRINALMCASGG